MISLDSTIYNVGDQIIKIGHSIDSVCFFFHGRAEMIGQYKESEDQEPLKIRVIDLCEGSWFGDYQILLGMVSNWDLIA